jgi:hypothetical protein
VTVRRSHGKESAATTPSPVAQLGLRIGDVVRFRRRENERWKTGRVVGREKDGSVSVRDEKGASRAITLDRLEVKDSGPRGGTVWESVLDRARDIEQLEMW